MKEQTNKDWYNIENIDEIDSPALVVYRQRVHENIRLLKSMIDDVERLRPHVKTHKAIEVTEMLIKAGIHKFKCATIAEAEMLAIANAGDVLLAYQPTGPKINRLIKLMKQYPGTKFSCLVDNSVSLKKIADKALMNNVTVMIYIDLNVGMNRTGIAPGNEAIDLYKACEATNGVQPVGLHVYDGHIRNPDFKQRTIECDKAFEPVLEMQHQLVKSGFAEPILIAGGSPTFPIHAKKSKRECSPGTFIYWDNGYQQTLQEQLFLTAALVVTRIISLPAAGILCLDLGHKSIGAENILDKRVSFLNGPDFKFISQSEEHLVVETNEGHCYKVGDVFYGLPYHICPTVALYDRAMVVENSKVTSEWKIIARDRKINW